ncbi:hypothetical protein BDQ12DRAFT_690865 [Crucibulum laeve]|uniref:Uncharacterized protein n=1 Tax=Crucibulum laeve TaxID=68775 RepID=A0A5C3LNV7_9AGAR|nr:hypothetical protein BDQ12DRAFT_690865 [Crucibulum laeve]
MKSKDSTTQRYRQANHRANSPVRTFPSYSGAVTQIAYRGCLSLESFLKKARAETAFLCLRNIDAYDGTRFFPIVFLRRAISSRIKTRRSELKFNTQWICFDSFSRPHFDVLFQRLQEDRPPTSTEGRRIELKIVAKLEAGRTGRPGKVASVHPPFGQAIHPISWIIIQDE